MQWKPRWWMPWQREPSRRDTIRAIQYGWGWTRAAATHAVDAWGFYPWQRMETAHER